MRARLWRGLQLFVAFTLAAFLILFLRGALQGNVSLLLKLPVRIFSILTLQSFLDLLLGGVRLMILTSAFGGDLRLHAATVANGANIVLGGITPSQTGGGPAQLFAMMRAGVPLRVATVTSLVGFLGTVLVLLGAGGSVALLRPSFEVPGGFRFFSAGTVGIFVAILLLFLLALPTPALHTGGLRRFLSRLPRVGARLARSQRLAQFERNLGDFATLLRRRGASQWRRIGAGLLLSAAIYLNKFLVAFVVLQGLGSQAKLWDVLYLQELQYLVMYFAPTPGASGVAELAAEQIMRPVVQREQFTAFVILWRVFTLYLPMLLAALLMMRELLRGGTPAPDTSRNGSPTRMVG
jgi:uncharacterized protein (TIRG00374 family)